MVVNVIIKKNESTVGYSIFTLGGTMCASEAGFANVREAEKHAKKLCSKRYFHINKIVKPF